MVWSWMVRKQAVVALAASFALAAPLACTTTTAVAPSTTRSVTAPAGGHELLAAADADALLRQPPGGLVVVDVRTPAEFAAGHLAGAIDVDLQSGTFAADVAKLDPRAVYFVYCHSGHRSAQAVTVMQQQGFTSIYELQGGIEAWLGAGLPLVDG